MMGEKIRLDKYLVEMNRGSRSQVKEAAKKGRIQVNGQAECRTERKIDPQEDTVTFDGVPIRYHAFEYYMLNKPQGVVSATEDKRHKTVTDLLDGARRKDLFPVGRLDIDTEGLLLLTNDGDLAHRLLAPGKHVDKQYYARVAGSLPPDAAGQVAAGMTLTDGTVVKPGALKILDLGGVDGAGADGSGPDGSLAQVLLTIQEGKYHQVKRMFEAMGCRVVYLKRLSMGTLKLDGALPAGAYRPLTEEELAALTNNDERGRL